MKRLYFAIMLWTVCGITTQGQVRLAQIFSDNMVLQRNVKIPVWGFAKANEKIAISFHLQTKYTNADGTGKWLVYLDDESAGGPYELVVKATSTLRVSNILVGEVWLCSGQSNMEWTVGQSDNASMEVANATNPMIRHIKFVHDINSVPSEEIKPSGWQVCSPKTVSDFSGVGYFYAKELQKKLNVPVGIINASWGGTNIETWISRKGFEQSEDFKAMIQNMPEIALDSLLKIKMTTAVKSVETLQKYKFTTVDVPFYKEVSYDDTTWLTLQQPGVWEEQSLGPFDGVVWLRKHFTLSKAQSMLPVSLEIPAIDDNDVTYVNGVKVGQTLGWDVKRNYLLPNSILKEGDNVIAIQVTDTGGGGGIYGDSNALKLLIGGNTFELAGNWKFQVEKIQNSVSENEFPSLCYNAMIHPLVPFAFKGVLWYQGESNATRAYEYRKAFPLLIADWRKQWNSDFPFYYVQLATFTTKGNSNEGCSWAELREAQTEALQVSNTGMVVTTDIGNPSSIHPTNKQMVGQRLAALAFSKLYGYSMVCEGPRYQSIEFKKNQAVVTFSSIGAGLSIDKGQDTLNGFEIAGEDQIFHLAKAVLKDDEVFVYSEAVAKPRAVRYGWKGDASDANLINREGFPAVPFRTDDWKATTALNHYEINISTLGKNK